MAAGATYQTIVPAAARSTITATTKTTFQVGSYSAYTDTFTSLVDLNDRVSFWLDTVDLGQPQKADARAFTLRAPGEHVTAWQYKNRHIKVSVHLLYQSGTANLLAAIRRLQQAAENPPYRLAFAPPSHTVLTYADVVRVTHTIPYDAKQILNGALTKINIDFECLPGFAGDRVYLSNLVVNPGFEGGTGQSITVFNDTFADLNAYTTTVGPLTLAGSVMTIPNGARAYFGSQAWGAIRSWQIRFQAAAGMQAYFTMHAGTGNKLLRANVTTAAFNLEQYDGTTLHNLGSHSMTLTAGSWYWCVMMQFPAAAGQAPYIGGWIYADSGGTVGANLVAITAVQTYDAVSAVVGYMAIETEGGALNVGGPYSGVNNVTIWGPGGWIFGNAAGKAVASGAWEQNSANCYQGGPVTSYGAARIDLPPAGAVSAYLNTYAGGTPSGQLGVMVAQTGDVVYASIYARSTGLSNTCTLNLYLNEYDGSGNYLRTNLLQQVTGNQASWVKLAGNATIGATTANIALSFQVIDATAGASANGTVWADNAQCWDATNCGGQSVMPYCEMRFPQSPAQFVIGSTQGDLAAPVHLSIGSYQSAGQNGSTLLAVLGRALTPSATAQLTSGAVGPIGISDPNSTSAPSVDASAFNGYVWYWNYTGPSSPATAWAFRSCFLSGLQNQWNGIYRVHCRVYDNATVTGLLAQVWAPQSTDQWDQTPTHANRRALYQGPIVRPIPSSSQSYWLPADCGQLILPSYGLSSLQDGSQNGYVSPSVYWTDSNAQNNAYYYQNWLALIPADGGYLTVRMNNTGSTNHPGFWWMYNDGLAVQQDGDPSWHFSFEGSPGYNPAKGVGGVGTLSSGAPSVNPSGAPYLQLDPTQVCNGWGGVNQLAGYAQNTSASSLSMAVAPMHLEMAYTPLYLTPRDQ